VNARPDIQGNGHDSTNGDKTAGSVGSHHDRAAEHTPVLHSGARLAAKLNAKIIVNDTEFNHAGEMSVDDRHSYHEALAAVFRRTL
jgi:hypothetical protein